jgi:ribonuclease P protein component
MSIPREHRLRRHSEFELVYSSGRRHFSTSLTVFYVLRPSAEGGAQVGITVGRQMGNAVTRNRVKRRVRAAIAASVATLTAPVDVVINPKKAVLDMDFAALNAEIARAFAVVNQKAAPPDANQLRRAGAHGVRRK